MKRVQLMICTLVVIILLTACSGECEPGTSDIDIEVSHAQIAKSIKGQIGDIFEDNRVEFMGFDILSFYWNGWGVDTEKQGDYLKVNLDFFAEVKGIDDPRIIATAWVLPSCENNRIVFRAVDAHYTITEDGGWLDEWIVGKVVDRFKDKIDNSINEFLADESKSVMGATRDDEIAKCYDVDLTYSGLTVTVGRITKTCGEGTDRIDSPYFDEYAYTPQPNATIESVSVQVERRDGVAGLNIDTTFTTTDLKGDWIQLTSYFSFKNGQVLRDFNDNYNSTDGQVAVSTGRFQLHRLDARLGKSMFIPHEELHLNPDSSPAGICVLVQLYALNQQQLLDEKTNCFTYTY